MKSKLFFFLPVAYFLRTRIASFGKLVSWLIIYCIPTAYILYNYSPLPLEQTISVYLLQLLLIYNFYEVGYIQNDCETIKHEQDPTMRLNPAEFDFYERYKVLIYGLRLLLGMLGLAVLYYALKTNGFVSIFGALLFAILLVYQVYNQVRSQLTLLLHFILVCLRFLSFPFLFHEVFTEMKLETACLLLIFPVINLIERGSNKKFNVLLFQRIIPDKSHMSAFRMKYYLLISVFLAALVFSGLLQAWVCYLSIYYFVYRLLIVKFGLE